MAYGDAAYQRSQVATEDLLGIDPLCRAFARQVVAMRRGSLVAVHGGPGSAKTDVIRRVAWILAQPPSGPLGLTPGTYFPGFVWFNPWCYAKQGNILSGLVAHVANIGPDPKAHLERTREIFVELNRMNFDGGMAQGGGNMLTGGETDPLERVQAGFARLVMDVKARQPGRLIIFVDELDQLRPAIRWSFLDGVRLLLGGGVDATVVMAIGRESALNAIRAREGREMPDISAARELEEVLDLGVHAPNYDPSRIEIIVRGYLPDEDRVAAVFGARAVTNLVTAVRLLPLGSPRFLARLAHRLSLLTEFAFQADAPRELSEVQCAWLVVGARWPEFHQVLLRGGRKTWTRLRRTLVGTADLPEDDPVMPWLARDPVLAEYLRHHAQGFEREMEHIFWLEDFLMHAGL